MAATGETGAARAAWFVGASFGGTDDQTERFVREGIWENGYRDRYIGEVKSIQPGDRIAIKSSFTQKHGLPFDARGHTVSVMAIKAVGRVLRNHGDGRHLDVAWTRLPEPIRWFFYTNRTTVWRVEPGSFAADALLACAFEGAAQDLARFRNAPYWRERFGDQAPADRRFAWTSFYEAMADALVPFATRRKELVAKLEELFRSIDVPVVIRDQFADGSTGFLRDICPFTFFGLFNRGITDENRKRLAEALRKLLAVNEPVPERFDGIPVLHNQRSWFFAYERKRGADDIDALWRVFLAAREHADSADPEARSEFASAFDSAHGRFGVAWNLTCGLYWIRPWTFLSLDEKSRAYLGHKLGLHLGQRGPKKRCNADDYLAAMDQLEARFQEPAFPVHSFPETSLAAWQYRDPVSPAAIDGSTQEPNAPHDAPESDDADATIPGAPPAAYTIENILADGCFLDRAQLEEMLNKLRRKKNLVLQGPPGTGKTWLAKRLGYALMGRRDERRLRSVQFHPSLSYEDFVQGFRPLADGKLELVDGLLLETVRAALRDPGAKYVVVIEEINRGNPAQILGEMLTLLESSKRTPDEAIALCHSRDAKPVYVPDNLYVLGTMNIADRSLAMVDFALRRRFAFEDLEPRLGEAWRAWVVKHGMAAEVAEEIRQRLTAVNERIAGDPTLGRQFRIGHSFVTPDPSQEGPHGMEWFKLVVASEIGPLLEEYWFDTPDKAAEARGMLLKGL